MVCLRIAALTALFACAPEEAVVRLTIRDPNASAPSADSVEIGSGFDVVGERRSILGHSFPMTVAVTSKPRSANIYVTAYDDDRPIAQGSTGIEVTFERGMINEASVSLDRICTEGFFCDDGIFCNGLESCIDGVCRPAPSPCEPDLACVDLACDEERDWCLITVDPSMGALDPCRNFACDQNQSGSVPNVEREGLSCLLPESNDDRICLAGRCEPTRCGDGILDPRHEICDMGDCLTCPLDLREARDPSFDPIGRWLAFETTNAAYTTPNHRPAIMLYDLETGELIPTDRSFATQRINDTSPQIGGGIVLFQRDAVRDASGIFDVATRRLRLTSDDDGRLLGILTADGGSIVDVDLGLNWIFVSSLTSTAFNAISFSEADVIREIRPSAVERLLILYEGRGIFHLSVLDTRTEERISISDGSAGSSAISADGKIVAFTIGFTVYVHEVDTGQQSVIDSAQGEITSVGTSSTGRFIAWSLPEQQEIVRYDRATAVLQTRSGAGDFAISSDGRHFIVGTKDTGFELGAF